MSTHQLQEDLSRGAQALGLALAESTQAQLLAYLDMIARWTQVYNLTAIRDPRAMLSQHLLDCLAVVAPMRRAAQLRGGEAPFRLLDVGSGAGLPGVVLAICEPAWQVVCVDAVAKKAGFIRQVAAELGLRGLTATHQRVEDMAVPPFDLITSRAFASLADFVALTRPLLAPGAPWAAMKAHLTEEERGALPVDVQIERVERLLVPGLEAERCLVWMRQLKA